MKTSRLLAAGLLLAAGCQPTSPPPALREAVAAYVRQHSARPASYQPLRWGPMRKWRKVDADSLNILRHRDHEDSVRVWWRQTYKKHGTALSQHFADSVYHLQDSLSTEIIHLNGIAAAYDTTRLGTQVLHTWQLRTPTGQLIQDSALFLVPRRGQAVRLPRLRPLY